MLTATVIDQIIIRRETAGFKDALVKFVVLILAAFVCATLVSFLTIKLDVVIVSKLKRIIFQKWGRARMDALSHTDVGTQMFQITSEVDSLKSAVIKIGSGIPVTICELIVYALMVYWLNRSAALLCCVILPLLLVANLRFQRPIRDLQARMQLLNGKTHTAVTQFFAGLTTVKVFAVERLMARKFVAFNSEIARLAMQQWRTETRAQAIRWLLTTGWSWVVFLYGVHLVLKDDMSLGQLMAIRIYYSFLERPINEIVDMIQLGNKACVSVAHIIESLSMPEEPRCLQVSVARPSPVITGPAKVSFERVYFSYPLGSPVLSSVSFDAGPGGLIGLAGSSGAGKTTLASLIARLYDPLSGTIFIDNNDIAQMPLQVLRSWIGICPQETHLFSGTLAENIAYGAPVLDRARIEAAARAAHAHDFIGRLDHGYDTQIKGLGACLSVGQKQRIGLARSFCRPSRILVLDEGLRGLDYTSRTIVMNSLREMTTHRTVFLISHEAEILKQCDNIFVLNQGHVSKENSSTITVDCLDCAGHRNCRERYVLET